MSALVGSIFESVRRPEYTGSNRCIPCTMVNIVIALAVAVVLAVLAPLGMASSFAVAGLFVLLSGLLIYLRGFLIPGTPWLTKTFFPDWLLRYFDHSETIEPADVDPYDILSAAGAIEECEEIDDLCVTDDFEAAWRRRIDYLRGSKASRADLAAVLEIPESSLSFEEHGSAFVALTDGGHGVGSEEMGRRRVGQWESEAAFLADVAGAWLLDNHFEGWSDLTPLARGQVLNGLRVFLKTCPICDGQVSLGEETVESCCRSIDVVAINCQECGARLFEAESP